MRQQLLPVSWEKGLGTGWSPPDQWGAWCSPRPRPGCGEGATHSCASRDRGRPPAWSRPPLVWRTRPPSGSEPHPG